MLSDADHILISIAPDEAGDPVLHHFTEEIAAAEAEVARLSLHRRRLWRPRRRLGRRDERMPARLEALARTHRGGGSMAAFRRRDRHPRRHRPPRRNLWAGAGAVREDPARDGAPHRQARPGLQPHPRRRHRRRSSMRLSRAAPTASSTAPTTSRPRRRTCFSTPLTLLGLPPPPEIAVRGGGAFSRWRGVSTANRSESGTTKIKRELGVRLAYPTYREGLKAVLEAGESTRG